MNNEVTANDPVGNEELHHHHGSKYSDYTEKLQSLYPKCKIFKWYLFGTRHSKSDTL